MKRYLILLAFVVFVAAAFMPPQGFVEPGSVLTSDGAAATEQGFLYGLVIMSDGTNAVTVDGYDNGTDASGTSIFPTWTTNASSTAQSITWDPPVAYYNGLFFDFTCAGTFKAMIYKRDRNP